MAGLFDDLIPKQKDIKIPNNIEVNTGMFSDLLPDEEKQKFKLTTEGNRGFNLSDKDKTEPGLFDDLKSSTIKNKESKSLFSDLIPEEKKKSNNYLKFVSSLSPLTGIAERTEDLVDDVDEDSTNLKKIAYAAQLGFFDTYRGGKQILGIDAEKMKADQKKLYEFMQDEDGSTNYGVAAAYFGGAILDPAGWLLPITKAKTLYTAAKYGFVNSGIIGALGYVDEESILDTRAKQAAASAVGGTILGPVITGVTKKIKGEKVFTRESLGIPGFDSPTIKVKSDTELQKIKLQNEAGLKDRNVVARKKIEIDEPETLKDIPTDKAKLLRGPRLWFRENVAKAYEKKFGKPALNYLTNGEYGAEAGAAGTGAVIGYASGDEDTPITTKFSRAFTGALLGAGGIKGARMKTLTKTFGKGEDKTEEYTKDHEIHIFHSFFSNLRRGKRHELYSILVFTKLETPNSAVVDFDLVIELDLNYGGYEKWSYDL